jgi:hypothetical protein
LDNLTLLEKEDNFVLNDPNLNKYEAINTTEIKLSQKKSR